MTQSHKTYFTRSEKRIGVDLYLLNYVWQNLGLNIIAQLSEIFLNSFIDILSNIS